MSDIDLRKIQMVQLELACVVKSICEKHNIDYFVIAGTLLGAIRHKGFIPWDDDLDIGMLREDYSKFLEVSKDELSDSYFLQTMFTDSEFGLPFAKLRKNGTKYVEKNSSKAEGHKGIFIDIFPFDNSPNSNFLKKLHSFETYILKRFILSKLGYEVWNDNSIFKKNIYRTISFIVHFYPLEKLKKLLCEKIKRYNHINTDNLVNIGGSYGYYKETMERKWLNNLVDVEFEGITFKAPENYDEYLKYLYGDYMTLPPEGERYNRHKIIEIDLGE